jgi:hypothetical protein
MALIRELNEPHGPDDVLRLIDLLLRDTFELHEIETRMDLEGRLVVSFPESELPTEFTVETRFEEPQTGHSISLN